MCDIIKETTTKIVVENKNLFSKLFRDTVAESIDKYCGCDSAYYDIDKYALADVICNDMYEHMITLMLAMVQMHDKKVEQTISLYKTKLYRIQQILEE